MTRPYTIPPAYSPEPPTHPTRQWCISQADGAPPLRVILYSDGDIVLCDGDGTISLPNGTATLLLPALSAALRWHVGGEAEAERVGFRLELPTDGSVKVFADEQP
jgi:hypothetical protein